MVKRKWKKLVLKIMVLFLTSSAFSEARTLKISWQDGRSEECHKLVLKFLTDLKDHTNDDIVEFSDIKKKRSPTDIILNCLTDKSNEPYLKFTQNADEVSLRFLGKHAGFDSLDWLQFQKRFIAEPMGLSDRPQLTLENLKAQSTSNELDVQAPSNLRYMVGLTSAAAGAFAGAYFSPNRESRLLNAALFGGLSGLAGYLLTGSMSGQ